MTSSELVVKVRALSRQIEEASAKGFRTKASMELVYSLESTVEKLLELATAEWLAQSEAA